MHNSIKMLATAGLLVLILAVAAEAQIRSIKGTVTDAGTGQPIANAQVIFQRIDIVQTMNAKTNSKGAYAYLLGQQAGTYRVIVHAQGYQPSVMENVMPDLGVDTIRDFKLMPGEDRKTSFEMTAQEKAEYDKRATQVQAAPKAPPMSDSATKDFAQAMKFVAAGKFEESIEPLKKVADKAPKTAAAAPLHSALGDSYSKTGKNEEAVASYRTAIELDSGTATFQGKMALVLNTMGKTAEAQEALKKAIALDPGSAEYWYNLGVIQVNSGQTDQAIQSFRKSIEVDPNYEESYYQLAICLSGSPQTMPEAIELLKKYMKIGKKPDQVKVAKDLIDALTKK
jgi:tetratricopeptide (TPR) repeat protein